MPTRCREPAHRQGKDKERLIDSKGTVLNRLFILCTQNRIPDPVYRGRLDLMMTDEVKQLMDMKWEHFGKPIFHRKFATGLLVQLLFFVSSVIFPDADMTLWRAYVSMVCQGVIGVLMLWQLYIEVRVVYIQRRAYGAAACGAAQLERVLGIMFYVTFGVTLGLQYGFYKLGAQHVMAAVTSLLGWCVTSVPIGVS